MELLVYLLFTTFVFTATVLLIFFVDYPFDFKLPPLETKEQPPLYKEEVITTTIGTNIDEKKRKKLEAAEEQKNIEEDTQNHKNALASFELLSQKEQRIFIGRILRDGLFKG